VARVLDLGPWFATQRIAAELTARCGIDYFTVPERAGPRFRLDPEKIDRVVELGRRQAARRSPWLPPDPHASARCRKLLRRELLQRLAGGLVEAGF
jgi:hypothetical protein